MKLPSGGDKWPNTDAYQGGDRKATGVTIKMLTRPGLIMLFKVEGIGRRSAAGPAALPPPDPRETTGEVLSWILSMLAGLGLMVELVGLSL